MTISDADVQSIPGAFMHPDFLMFRALLKGTADAGPGDLAELGALYGKSAVLIGSHLGDGETFTVVDLCEDEAADEANAVENAGTYPGLTRRTFEENYARVLGRLPSVVQGLSQEVLNNAAHGTHRFVHIDASHLYEHVRVDIKSSRVLLRPEGVVVLDDYRAPHTPGVAAAAWESVLNGGLRPFALSPQKMYATWGNPDPWREVVEAEAVRAGLPVAGESVAGHTLARVGAPRQHRLRAWVPDAALPAARRAWRAGYRLKNLR